MGKFFSTDKFRFIAKIVVAHVITYTIVTIISILSYKRIICCSLAQHWSINRSEIVAFGDVLNDMDMLSFAGVSVAMSTVYRTYKITSKASCYSHKMAAVYELFLNKVCLYRNCANYRTNFVHCLTFVQKMTALA